MARKPWRATLNGSVVGSRAASASFAVEEWDGGGREGWRDRQMEQTYGRCDAIRIPDASGEISGRESYMHAKPILVHCPACVCAALWTGQTVWHEHSGLTKQGLCFIEASCPCFLFVVREGEQLLSFQRTCRSFWPQQYSETFEVLRDKKWLDPIVFLFQCIHTLKAKLALNCSLHFSYEHSAPSDQPPNRNWTVHFVPNIYLLSGPKGRLSL